METNSPSEADKNQFGSEVQSPGRSDKDKPIIVPVNVLSVNASGNDINASKIEDDVVPLAVEKKEEKEKEKEKEKKTTMKEKVMGILDKIEVEPLIAIEHRGQKLNDYTQFPCCKFRVKNLWAYIFSVFIIFVLISQIVVQLKKMGSIIKIETNKSYFESWTKADKKFCQKFPSKVKAMYSCGQKSRYDYKKKKAYTKKDIEGQAEIMKHELVGMNMPLDMTIETDSKCSDYKVSLVLDPKLIKLLGKKPKDFKSYELEGKKFEYDADEGPLGDEYGDEDFEDYYGDEEGLAQDDDYYRRRLQYDDYYTFTETKKGFYEAFANNGVKVAGCMNRNSLGSSKSDYTNDKYTKRGWEAYYVSDTGEEFYKEYSYELTNYDPSKALSAPA